MSLMRILAAATFIASPLAAMAQTVVQPTPPAVQEPGPPPSTQPLAAPPIAPPARVPEAGSRALAPLAPTQNFDATPRQAAPGDRQLPMSGK